MQRYLRASTLVAVAFVTTFSAAQNLTDAPAQFHQKCATCHGSDGRAKTQMAKMLGARDLTSPEVQKLSNEELKSVIMNGKGKMPAFSGSLGSAGVDSMIKYLRTTLKAKK